MLTKEGGREDGDVEDDTNGVKDRESQDELNEGLLEIKYWRQDDEDSYDVACNNKRQYFDT